MSQAETFTGQTIPHYRILEELGSWNIQAESPYRPANGVLGEHFMDQISLDACSRRLTRWLDRQGELAMACANGPSRCQETSANVGTNSRTWKNDEIARQFVTVVP
jgi:hypothetical protein